MNKILVVDTVYKWNINF